MELTVLLLKKLLVFVVFCIITFFYFYMLGHANPDLMNMLHYSTSRSRDAGGYTGLLSIFMFIIVVFKFIARKFFGGKIKNLYISWLAYCVALVFIYSTLEDTWGDMAGGDATNALEFVFVQNFSLTALYFGGVYAYLYLNEKIR